MAARWATASASSFKGPTASSRGGLDDALRPLGLTGRQLIILGAIAEYRKLRQSELAEVVGKDHTTITANLGSLTARGLVVSTTYVSGRLGVRCQAAGGQRTFEMN
jgi:hypothetical protein